MRLDLSKLKISQKKAQAYINAASTIDGQIIEIDSHSYKIIHQNWQYRNDPTIDEIYDGNIKLPQGPKGLGDMVHNVLKPFVGVADRYLGTHLNGCSACAARQKKLNELFPI